MFTGLIEGTGTVLSITRSSQATGPTRLVIAAPALAARLHTGDSIAVSGVCLTALAITETQFAADLAQETVERTKLVALTIGSVVNLELPTPAGSPLGGHVVQGHVDGVGTLLSVEALDPADQVGTDWRLRLRIPASLIRYVVPQGSITIDGISLTVADLAEDVVSIAIIPHTYRATGLNALAPGSPLNIEVDVLAKYAERQAEQRTRGHWSLSEEYLLANGY